MNAKNKGSIKINKIKNTPDYKKNKQKITHRFAFIFLDIYLQKSSFHRHLENSCEL